VTATRLRHGDLVYPNDKVKAYLRGHPVFKARFLERVSEGHELSNYPRFGIQTSSIMEGGTCHHHHNTNSNVQHRLSCRCRPRRTFSSTHRKSLHFNSAATACLPGNSHERSKEGTAHDIHFSNRSHPGWKAISPRRRRLTIPHTSINLNQPTTVPLNPPPLSHHIASKMHCNTPYLILTFAFPLPVSAHSQPQLTNGVPSDWTVVCNNGVIESGLCPTHQFACTAEGTMVRVAAGSSECVTLCACYLNGNCWINLVGTIICTKSEAAGEMEVADDE
jgi:hypothetical protein